MYEKKHLKIKKTGDNSNQSIKKFLPLYISTKTILSTYLNVSLLATVNQVGISLVSVQQLVDDPYNS